MRLLNQYTETYAKWQYTRYKCVQAKIEIDYHFFNSSVWLAIKNDYTYIFYFEEMKGMGNQTNKAMDSWNAAMSGKFHAIYEIQNIR